MCKLAAWGTQAGETNCTIRNKTKNQTVTGSGNTQGRIYHNKTGNNWTKNPNHGSVKVFQSRLFLVEVAEIWNLCQPERCPPSLEYNGIKMALGLWCSKRQKKTLEKLNSDVIFQKSLPSYSRQSLLWTVYWRDYFLSTELRPCRFILSNLVMFSGKTHRCQIFSKYIFFELWALQAECHVLSLYLRSGRHLKNTKNLAGKYAFFD